MKKYNAVKDTVVLIPTLNPDDKLINYIRQLIEIGFENIVVVNDGSDERCKYVFETISKDQCVVLLEHDINRGKGRALKTGFAYCAENYTDCAGVITADSDGQHSPADTFKVAEALCEYPDELILGTRNFNEEQVPFKSRYGNKITTVVFKLLYGRHINDTQTGLRGVGIRYLEEMCRLEGERFEYEIKMLIMAARESVALREVLIETIYIDDNKETHFDPVKDSIKIYKVLFKSFFMYILSSFSSFLIDMGIFSLLSVVILKNISLETNVLVSTVLARVISSLYNFVVNHKVVFKSRGNMLRNALGYYLLAIVQMCCSAALVYLLADMLKFSTVISKVIVDTLLFCISYQIQQRLIFKK